MQKLQINTIKNPLLNQKLNYSGHVVNKTPKHIEYVGPFRTWEGITVFTDECFDGDNLFIVEQITSSHKLAWIHEPRGLNPLQNSRYNNLEKNLDKFDRVMTYDAHLLSQYPHKTIFTADNAIWLEEKFNKVHPKNSHVSMIYSWKNWTEGHRLRHIIAQNAKGVDLYGTGAQREIQGKEEGLMDYKYSIVVENSWADFYFTEKILDCFACGTIPIYWGCPNIGDFFNEKGIMKFSNLEDLSEIFKTLSQPNHYEKTLPYIEENFKKVLEYNIYEDWIYNNVYNKIIEE